MELIMKSIHACSKEEKNVLKDVHLTASINAALSKDELERPEVVCYIKVWQKENQELFMIKATYRIIDIPVDFSREDIVNCCNELLESRVEVLLGLLGEEMGYVDKLGW